MSDRSEILVWRVIRIAFDRGYRVSSDGILTGAIGRSLRIVLHGKQRYPTFSVRVVGLTPSGVYGVPAHLFAAFCFYGDAVMKNSVQVRHLNGNTLDISKGNIALGSGSDNQYDKPASLRIGAARAARAAQPIEGTTAKLSMIDVQRVRDFYAQFGGKKPPNGTVSALAAELGVNRNALAAIKSGKTWQNIAKLTAA